MNAELLANMAPLTTGTLFALAAFCAALDAVGVNGDMRPKVIGMTGRVLPAPGCLAIVAELAELIVLGIPDMIFLGMK